MATNEQLPGGPADPGRGDRVLDDALRSARARFGARLLAAYAIGSLAHGGFAPLVSDVDLALVLADPLTAQDRGAVDALSGEQHARGGLAARLSVFWTSPEQLRAGGDGGRLPCVDRQDLIEHGRLLAGTECRSGAAVPSSEQLRREGIDFARAKLLDDRLVDDLTDPAALVESGPRPVTKRVLFPVRLLFTASCGAIGRNEAAIAWYCAGSRAAAPLVAAAGRWRTEGLGAEAVTLLQVHLAPLYGEMLDDFIARADAAGDAELRAASGAWRDRVRALGG